MAPASACHFCSEESLWRWAWGGMALTDLEGNVPSSTSQALGSGWAVVWALETFQPLPKFLGGPRSILGLCFFPRAQTYFRTFAIPWTPSPRCSLPRAFALAAPSL